MLEFLGMVGWVMVPVVLAGFVVGAVIILIIIMERKRL